MAQVDPFARDLGYLAKFLESLRSHAATLEPVAGQRLLSLLDEEAGRWDEIKRILAGQVPGAPAAQAVAQPQASKAPEPEAPPAPQPEVGRPNATGFTVGSLRGR